MVLALSEPGSQALAIWESAQPFWVWPASPRVYRSGMELPLALPAWKAIAAHVRAAP